MNITEHVFTDFCFPYQSIPGKGNLLLDFSKDSTKYDYGLGAYITDSNAICVDITKGKCAELFMISLMLSSDDSTDFKLSFQEYYKTKNKQNDIEYKHRYASKSDCMKSGRGKFCLIGSIIYLHSLTLTNYNNSSNSSVSGFCIRIQRI